MICANPFHWFKCIIYVMSEKTNNNKISVLWKENCQWIWQKNHLLLLSISNPFHLHDSKKILFYILETDVSKDGDMNMTSVPATSVSLLRFQVSSKYKTYLLSEHNNPWANWMTLIDFYELTKTNIQMRD